MVGGNHVVEHAQSKSPACLIQPLAVVVPVAAKLQQELPLMAAMGKMPHEPWDEMTIRAWHQDFR